MKAIFTTLSLLLLLSGCGAPQGSGDATPEEARLTEQAAILSKVIHELDTTQQKSVSAIEKVPGLQSLMDSVLDGKTGYGVFYLLNSGCSVCIGDLIAFNNVMDRTGLGIPVYVVPASRNHVPTIEYYLEQPELKSGVAIRVIKHSLPGSPITDLNKTVVISYGKRAVEQFVFE